ncbi:universal stress protein [Saccharomonospora azurea]|uniref:Universal stress protein UspA-like protein n=1 Tax=Saccharomonospora azurea NA-128 TaxID=882081 RepID=H8GEC2_9PSEU|nr:universal stress protein [Saccharomonospora azurea]EHY87917.1 universal stress protein UspA-like protein [Saccharomonospora azurea NA-128]
MSTIVVGVDGSESALGAVRWAAEEAALRADTVRLVHAYVVPLHGYPDFVATFPRLRDGMRHQGGAWLDEARETVGAVAPDVPVETDLVEEEAVSALVEESRRARITVLGSRGLGGFTGMLVGSVAVGLATHGHSPVVVVRRSTESLGPEAPIVVGADGSEASTAALRFAFDEAVARAAPVTVVRTWRGIFLDEAVPRYPMKVDPAEIEDGERAALAEQVGPLRESHPDIAVETVVVRGRPVRTLLHHGRSARMLVVGSRGRSGFSGMLLGSTSQALVTHAPCPVAVIRSGE